MIELGLLRIRTFLWKVTLKIGQEKSLLSILKTNPWTYKIKYLNGEKIIGSFYEKRIVAVLLSRAR